MLFSAGLHLRWRVFYFLLCLYPEFTKIYFILLVALLAEALHLLLKSFSYTPIVHLERFQIPGIKFSDYGYAITVFVQTLLINMVASGMLTPGDSITWGQSGLMPMAFDLAKTWWINGTTSACNSTVCLPAFPTWLLDRFAGMLHYRDRKGTEDRKYWDWVGLMHGDGVYLGLVIQPVLGMVYMLAIKDNQVDAFEMIMHGSSSVGNAFDGKLLSALFLAAITYFIDRREKITLGIGK